MKIEKKGLSLNKKKTAKSCHPKDKLCVLHMQRCSKQDILQIGITLDPNNFCQQMHWI